MGRFEVGDIFLSYLYFWCKWFSDLETRHVHWLQRKFWRFDTNIVRVGPA